MSHVDLTLKKLVSGGAPEFLVRIGLPRYISHLPGEVHELTELRVDLLATQKGESHPFFHAEMQSGNSAGMLIRMLRYHGGIASRLVQEGRHSLAVAALPDIHQVCVYFGQPAMDMPNDFRCGRNTFGYDLLDVRDLRHEELVASTHINDVVLSVVCGGGHTAANIDHVLLRIAKLALAERTDAFVRLIVLSSLRGMQNRVLKRRSEMGFAIDVSDVPFLNEAFRRERDTGIQTGRAAMVVDALKDRFGEDAVPEGTLETLEDLKPDVLLRMISRVPQAKSIGAVLGNHMPAPTYGP